MKVAEPDFLEAFWFICNIGEVVQNGIDSF